MKERIDLAADEVVLLKNNKVLHGGVMSNYTNTLMLTNKRIIFIKKGILGKTKEILSYPLANLKVYNDRAQAMIGKDKNNRNTLDLFFISNEESFGFEFKKDIIVWIKKINEVTTGKVLKTEEIEGANTIIPGLEEIASSVKATVDICKDAFGLKKKEVYVSCSCKKCGATSSGIKGESAKCPYCGNYITFE